MLEETRIVFTFKEMLKIVWREMLVCRITGTTKLKIVKYFSVCKRLYGTIILASPMWVKRLLFDVRNFCFSMLPSGRLGFSARSGTTYRRTKDSSSIVFSETGSPKVN